MLAATAHTVVGRSARSLCGWQETCQALVKADHAGASVAHGTWLGTGTIISV